MKRATTSTKSEGTQVRVLVDGHYGKANTVVTLDDDVLTVAVAAGQVDADPSAVAAAEGK